MNALALTFRDTTFHPIIRNNQPWLTGTEIAQALGYANEDAVSRIYRRNAKEFTESMTAVIEKVKLTVSKESTTYSNLKEKVRIFSLRGAHLIGMFARTELAAEFRRWVLDVLEKHTQSHSLPLPKTKKALPGGLTLEQQDAIKALVRSRVDALPEHQRAKAAITCWSSLKSKFGCTYKAIPSEYFGEALSLVARLPLEGELLPPRRKSAKRYHYPRKLLEQPHFTAPQTSASLGVSMLANTKEFVSPLFALLNELRTDGHEVSAPWDEAVAMREAIQQADQAMEKSIHVLWNSRFAHASTAGNT